MIKKKVQGDNVVAVCDINIYIKNKSYLFINYKLIIFLIIY